jgi:hypothetical protein
MRRFLVELAEFLFMCAVVALGLWLFVQVGAGAPPLSVGFPFRSTP